MVGDRRLGGQWVVFYALLGLARIEGDGWLDVDELHRHAPWSTKQSGSVGKEVARHVKNSPARLVRSRKGTLTRSWRLTVKPTALELLPSLDSVRNWIRTQLVEPAQDLAAVLVRTRRLVNATIALQKGRLDHAVIEVADPQDRLAAWEICHMARWAQRAEDEEMLASMAALAQARMDALGLSLRRRILAARALITRFEAARKTLPRLVRESEKLATLSDVATEAVVENVRATLLRRLDRVDEALSAHLSALPALGIVGDYSTLQACLFGIGHCLGVVAKRGGTHPSQHALDFVELSLAVCDAFALGNDSAQAEILAARWSGLLGQEESARKWLARAEQIVSTGVTDFDLACFHRARAELIGLEVVTGNLELDALTAIRMFERLGDDAAAARTRDDLLGPSRKQK